MLVRRFVLLSSPCLVESSILKETFFENNYFLIPTFFAEQDQGSSACFTLMFVANFVGSCSKLLRCIRTQLSFTKITELKSNNTIFQTE